MPLFWYSTPTNEDRQWTKRRVRFSRQPTYSMIPTRGGNIASQKRYATVVMKHSKCVTDVTAHTSTNPLRRASIWYTNSQL